MQSYSSNRSNGNKLCLLYSVQGQIAPIKSDHLHEILNKKYTFSSSQDYLDYLCPINYLLLSQ